MTEASTRRRRIPILWLMIAALGVLAGFAALFEIDHSVRATGQVIPGLRTQIIQAVDGGVLTAIHVREGDRVTQGQRLAELEPDRAAAGESQSRAEVASKRAALARAAAELAEEAPVFGPEFDDYPHFVAAQEGIYRQRRRSLDEELSVLNEAMRLAADELSMNEQLYETGDVAKSEILRLQRQVLDLKARISATRNKYLTDTRQELARLEEELSSSRYRLEERSSILAHTDLLAPTDGLVKYIRVNTVGGVLRPGDELMQISPVDDELLVEVRINPADIGQLATGLPTSLRFDAFDSSLFGSVSGRLRYVSPDTLSEQGPDGASLVYYRGQVGIDWSTAVAGSTHTLRPEDVKPGMTVTADLLVGKRTILFYLLKPIMRGFSGALTER